MSVVELKDPTIRHSSGSQLKQIHRNLTDFKNNVIDEEKELSSNQTNKLKQFISQITELKKKVISNKTECIKNNAKLNEEIMERQIKLDGFHSGAKNAELEADFKKKISGEEQKYRSNCQKRVEVANSINYQKLRKIEVDERRSVANEVFKWIMVAMYVEPDSKYYWPNFKDQVLNNKEALEDLRERLGKISAYSVKEEQRVHTAKFIQLYPQIRQSPEFHGFEQELQKLHEISNIFSECIEIGRRVRDYEKQVEKNKKRNDQADEGLVQLSKECDALTEKYKLAELYIKQLTSIEQALSNKISRYEQEVRQAEAFSDDFANLSESKLSAPLEPERRQNCECSIF